MSPEKTLIGFRVLKGRMGKIVSQFDLRSSGLSADELEAKIKVTLRLLEDDPTVCVVKVYRLSAPVHVLT